MARIDLAASRRQRQNLSNLIIVTDDEISMKIANKLRNDAVLAMIFVSAAISIQFNYD